MIVSTTKTETFQCNTWDGNNIAIFVQFCIKSEKVKYILGQLLTKILLLFRE